jgi:hypothetical protein
MPAPQGNIKVVVYALSDPRNPKLPFYVGKTSCSLKRRLSAHRCWSKKFTEHPLSKWFLGLAEDGIIPTIYELESCPTAPIAKEREVCWINFFRPLGTLTNKSDGDGSLGMKKGPPCLANRLATIARNKKGWSNEMRSKMPALIRNSERCRNLMIPVFCETNQKHYACLADAEKDLKIASKTIRTSIKENKPTKGLVFRKVENALI